MPMNVYDFDGTIFDGDSSIGFYLFCLKRQPSLIRDLPRQAAGAIGYWLYLFGLFRASTKTKLKEKMYSYIKHVRRIDEALEQFWATHDVMDWYKAKRRDDDIIISASPEFLLRPVARRLGVALIASRVDSATGFCDGENCGGIEKVRRFREMYGDAVIDEFYSDSNADLPLANVAVASYKVRRGKITRWF